MAKVTNTSTMAVNKNMIIPEVYAELVREKIAGKCKVAQFCVVKGDLQGKPGETLKLPAYKYIGDAKDWEIGTAMTAGELEQTTTDLTIKAVAAPGINVYDYDNEVEMGNALQEGASQQSVSISRKMDTDAINAALTSPLKKKLAAKNKVTQDEMIEILGLYGDDRDSADFDAIVIHSAFAPSFYAMDMFTSREKTMAKDGNGIAVNGVIGYFLDIPVVLSDRLYDTTNTEGFILVMKKGALGIVPKEVPFVEVARDASKRLSTVYTSDLYALGLIDDTAIVYAKTVIG